MSDTWEVFEIVGTEEDAELIAGFLRNEEIPCRVESAHSHEFPVNVNTLGDVRLLVHREHAERAQPLIDEGQARIAEGESLSAPE